MCRMIEVSNVFAEGMSPCVIERRIASSSSVNTSRVFLVPKGPPRLSKFGKSDLRLTFGDRVRCEFVHDGNTTDDRRALHTHNRMYLQTIQRFVMMIDDKTN